MGMRARIMLAYRRWRHSRGYGVHSPYAYRLVKLALHPQRGYGYYGYDSIEQTLPSGESYGQTKRKDARLLLRLAVTSGVDRVIVETLPPIWLEAAVEAAGIPVVMSDESETPSDGDILLTRGNGNVTLADKWLAAHAMVVSFDPGERMRSLLKTPRENGLRFIGKRVIVASGREDMAFVSYDMRF